MKNNYLALFACLLSLVVTSCTTEDIDDTSTILGEWTLTSWEVSIPIDLNNDGTLQSKFTPGCLTDSFLNFMDTTNGTLFYSSDVSYNTRIENGKQIFMTSCTTDSNRVPTLIHYSNINENQILIDVEGENIELTKIGNTLTMFVSNGFEAKDIDTLETTVLQDVTYVFTR